MNITVIGKGYVGEHVGQAFTAAGHDVRYYDPPKGLNALRGDQDTYVICVPTPLDGHGAPDLRHVIDAVRSVEQVIDDSRPSLIVLESTVGPGTTRRLLGPLHDRGHRVAYSPERIDPGSGRNMRDVPKLLAGIDAQSLWAASAIYGATFTTVVDCPSLEVAELAKLHENAYRAANIALADELGELCRALDVDVRAVLDAADTKPFGFQRFDPGAGPGGHCIPVDPAYLLHVADGEHVRMRTLEAAQLRNTTHPVRNAARVAECLPNGGKVAVLGLTYKPGMDDTRNSAGMLLFERLRHLGYSVGYADPFVTHPDDLAPLLGWADLIVVCTAHPEYLDLRDRTGTPVLDLTGEVLEASAVGRAAA